MEKLSKSLIISSAILEINRNKITLEEIYNYKNKIFEKLGKIGYTFDSIDFLDVVYFCEAYDINCTRDKIINLNKETINKLKKASLGLSKELKDALKFDKKYVLPLKEDENVNLYYVNFMNRDLVDYLQTDELVNYNGDGEYIINLNQLISTIDIDKLNILRNLFMGSTFNLKSCYKSDDIIKIMQSLDFVMKENFIKFCEAFSNSTISKDKYSKEYNELYNIYTISKINATYMENIGLTLPLFKSQETNQKVLTKSNN